MKNKMKNTACSMLMAGIVSSGVALAQDTITLSPDAHSAALGPVLYCDNATRPNTLASIGLCNALLVTSAACNPEIKAQLSSKLGGDSQVDFLNQVLVAEMYYANHPQGGMATCLTTILHGILNAQLYATNHTI